MQKSVVEMGTLAALLLGAALAWGQQPASPAPVQNAPKDQPAKSKLEEMIEKALHDNPDLRLAEAKLAEAEAELNKARLLVVQKVAAQYQAVEAQKAAVEGAAAELEETKTAYKAATVSQSVVRTAEQKLIDAKAKLASLEAELPYLLGQQAEGKIDAKIRIRLDRLDLLQAPKNADAEYQRRWYLDVIGRVPTAEEMAAALPKPAIQGPTADRICAALDKPFTYDCKEKSIEDILRDMNKAFQEANPGLIIKDGTNIGKFESTALSAHFDKMPFGAALEWVEDSMNARGVGDFNVVIRDYGIAIVDHDRVPPVAPLLRDFWKGAKAEDKTSPKGGSNPSGPPLDGRVKAVMVKSDGLPGTALVTLGLGDGVAKGDILMVIRQESEAGRAVMIGQLRIIRVGEGESTSELVGKFAMPVRVGDKVYPEPKDKPAAKDQSSDPTAKPVEGQVKYIGEDNRIHINFGKKDGLVKGDTLKVFHQDEKTGRSVLLTTIRVVLVDDDEALAILTVAPEQPIQAGDRVRRVEASGDPNK